MADTKISALSAKTTPASADLLVLVDVADTTMAPSGTDKKTTVAQLMSTRQLAVASKTSAYTLTAADDVVIGDPSGGSFTLTLPTAVGATKPYTIKRSDATLNNTNVLTVGTTSSQTFDGGATTLTLDLHNHWVTVASDGSNWQVVDIGPGVRTRFRQTTSGSASGTSDVTALGSGVGSLTLPANFFTPGKTIRLTARGIYTCTTGGGVVGKVKLGSTVVATFSNSSGASLTNREWYVDCLIQCQSAGASGTVTAAGTQARHTAAATSVVVELVPSTAGPTTVDTTSSLALDYTINPGHAATVFTTQIAVLESLN